jgi:hypothetical protein
MTFLPDTPKLLVENQCGDKKQQGMNQLVTNPHNLGSSGELRCSRNLPMDAPTATMALTMQAFPLFRNGGMVSPLSLNLAASELMDPILRPLAFPVNPALHHQSMPMRLAPSLGGLSLLGHNYLARTLVLESIAAHHRAASATVAAVDPSSVDMIQRYNWNNLPQQAQHGGVYRNDPRILMAILYRNGEMNDLH